MALLKDFRDFAARGNVLDLAVAVVIGAAFQKIVTSIVADLIMPLVSALMPQGDWRAWKVTPLKFAVGDVLGAIVDFLIVALVLFVVVVQVGKRFKKDAPAEAPATKQCPECLEMIPLAARKCRACGSVVVGTAAGA